MPLAEFFDLRKRINVLKKIKVDGKWRLCPAVIEAGGKLKDRVRVHGQIETHLEGSYCIEWREDGKRRRLSIPQRQQVLERARLKSLELEGVLTPQQGARTSADHIPASGVTTPVVLGPSLPWPSEGGNVRLAIEGIAASVSTYLRELTVMLEAAALNAQALPRSNESAPASEPDRAELGSHPVRRLSLVPKPALPSSDTATAMLPLATNSIVTPIVVPLAQTSQPTAPKAKQLLLADAIAAFLKNVQPPQREPKTFDEYRLVLKKFQTHCPKKVLAEINRDDLLEFMRHLYSMGNEPYTIRNRIAIVEQVLKLNGITGLLHKRDKPVPVRTIREMYQPEDMEALFKACDPDERVRYMFFLLSGERDREVRHTSWSDIDFNGQCVRVTAKKQLRFKPKDKEEREIPVPQPLMQILRLYKERQSGVNPHNLVFPTDKGKTDKKFENKLKRLAFRSGLNCGHCTSKYGNKCAEGPHCSKWGLHKFRHTFATASLESNVSIRTLQEWMGHSDIETTMVYLKFVKRKDIAQIIDRGQLGQLAAQFVPAEPPAAAPAPTTQLLAPPAQAASVAGFSSS
jgi:integrase